MPSSDLSQYDLLIAFRKAKADLFYSRSSRIEDLYRYERDLEKNLTELYGALIKRDQEWFFRRNFLGSFTFIPSGIKNSSEEAISEGNIATSGVVNLGSEQEIPLSSEATAEFRIMENCSIHFHVLSALWIAKIGIHLDNLLGEEIYANRVRKDEEGNYRRFSIGSFKPYFHGYKRWQESGYTALNDLLERDKKALAITTDVSSYFHNLDPTFLLNEHFLSFIKRLGCPVSELGGDDQFLHEIFVKALSRWQKSVGGKLKLSQCGVPVGLPASALIANIALIELDRQIQEELKPRFYGRYVDDIMIVLEGGEHFKSDTEVWKWLTQRVESLEIKKDPNTDTTSQKSRNPHNPIIRVKPSYIPESNLRFSPLKTQITKLDGFRGKQTLQSLLKTMGERSSEWNLLPVIPTSPNDVPNLILKAFDADGSAVDNLSKVSRLTIERAGFAIQLRNFEALGRDVSPDSWEAYRRQFYLTVKEQVLSPVNYFKLAKYFPRLFALAISCGDWDEAADLLRKIMVVFEAVAPASPAENKKENSTDAACKIQIKGYEDQSPDDSISAVVRRKWIQETRKTIISTLNATSNDKGEIDKLLELINKSAPAVGQAKQYPTFTELFKYDLARIPFKTLFAPSYLRNSLPADVSSGLPVAPWSHALAKDFQEPMGSLISTFNKVGNPAVDEPHQLTWNSHGLIFPTRPLGASEILLWFRLLDYPELQRYYASWLSILRGHSDNKWFSDAPPPGHIALKNEEIPDKDGKVRIAVGSLLTTSDSMGLAAKNKPDLTLKRYGKITNLINDVISVSEDTPHYLLLPEVSIPAAWFLRLAEKLKHKNISLIAGVEFLVINPKGADKLIRNQIWHNLVHSAFGFSTSAVYRQDKQRPAPGEESFLWNLDKLRLKPEIPFTEHPPIIKHGNFMFASLICSELTNSKYRSSLRGKIDALMLVESNRDLRTFNALVESSALDIHCYVAQANNRIYGDSRIRAPYKTDHKRDVIRIRGGLNDHFVIGNISVRDLRQFQSSYRNPDGNFKPLPDGFHDDMDSNRRIDP